MLEGEKKKVSAQLTLKNASGGVIRKQAGIEQDGWMPGEGSCGLRLMSSTSHVTIPTVKGCLAQDAVVCKR